MKRHSVIRWGGFMTALVAFGASAGCGEGAELEAIGDTVELGSATLSEHPTEPPKPERDCHVPGTVTFVSDYMFGSLPAQMVRGRKDAVWFTDYERSQIGRIGRSGDISWFEPVVFSQGTFGEVAADRYGNVWFSGNGELGDVVGRMTSLGEVTLFPLPREYYTHFMTAGSDRDVWFSTSVGKLGHIASTGEMTFIDVPLGSPFDLVMGPSRSIWFTLPGTNRIGRRSEDGSFAAFDLPTPSGGLWAIAAGPDGSIWFSKPLANRIGRISPTGEVREFEVPGNLVYGDGDITVGPDGALWFGQLDPVLPPVTGTNRIARLTSSGELSELPLPRVHGPELFLEPVAPNGVAFGADGNLWVTASLLYSAQVGVVLRVTPTRCHGSAGRPR